MIIKKNNSADVSGLFFYVDQSAKEKSATVLRPFFISSDFTLPSLANQPMAARISVSAIWLLSITGEPYKQIIGYFD